MTESATAPATSPALPAEGRLKHYPITFFAVSMGMMGLALASRAATKALTMSDDIAFYVLCTAGAALIAISIGYLAKALLHPAAIVQEWQHPVKIAFFPAISISWLLFSSALAPYALVPAQIIWIGAATLQGILALAVIGVWIGHRTFHHVQMSPAWFIPAVGNVIVPLSGVAFGHVEISWLFFSAGLMFWIVLLTLVVNRLMFHEPLPGRLVATLTILIAPPAVAYISWVRLTGESGPAGHLLLSLGYAFALIVLTQVRKFLKMPFALSWWALSFPVAALCVASFIHAEEVLSRTHQMLGVGLLLLLSAIIAMLLTRTVIAMARNEICVPE